MIGNIQSDRAAGVESLIRATGRVLYRKSGLQFLALYPRYAMGDDDLEITVDGVNAYFPVGSYTEWKRHYTLMNEKRTIEDALDELRPDDVFYDVGANVGTYATLVGSALVDGTVVAFEPHPENVDSLRKNADRNGLDCIVRREALSDTDGTAKLAIEGETAGQGEHALAPASGNGEPTLEVDVVTGDSIVEDGSIPAPDVVKVDVEGAELRVVEGMEKTLATHCRVLYCEVHPRKMRAFGTSPGDLFATLRRLGFDIAFLDGVPGNYQHVKCMKEASCE